MIIFCFDSDLETVARELDDASLKEFLAACSRRCKPDNAGYAEIAQWLAAEWYRRTNKPYIHERKIWMTLSEHQNNTSVASPVRNIAAMPPYTLRDDVIIYNRKQLQTYWNLMEDKPVWTNRNKPAWYDDSGWGIYG